MNKVNLVVNRNSLPMTARFEFEGDIWEWLKKSKKKNSHAAYTMLQEVRYDEEHTFYYETKLEKFIRRFRDCDIELVEK